MTQTFSATPRWMRKLREWTVRYVPAEIIGTVSALACAIAAFGATGDRAVAAITGAAAENVGFYTVMAIAEWRHQRRPEMLPKARHVLRVMVAEFGAAEALDSLLLRPICMYVAPILTGKVGSGALLGKVMADAIFYGAAIISYEMALRSTHRKAVGI